MRGLIRRVRLLFSTARYLEGSQIRSRLLQDARRYWRRVARPRAPMVEDARIGDHRALWPGIAGADLTAPAVQASIAAARSIAQGRFTFLNRAIAFQEEPNWRDPELPQLWRYHLHYFEYVRDLALLAYSGERASSYQCFRHLVRSWISANDVLTGDGWHPYTVSIRIVSWCSGADVFAAELRDDPDFSRQLLGSLSAQAGFLAANLETDVRGNHLLKNIRGLIWAGVFFAGKEAASWLEVALPLLEMEIAEQVLPDGGHFERVPGYHRQVMSDVLETALFMERNGRRLEYLDDVIGRMRTFALAITPPNGRAPLLKDTALGMDPETADVIEAAGLFLRLPRAPAAPSLYSRMLFDAGHVAAARSSMPSAVPPVPSAFLPGSGYAVMRDDDAGDHLIFDVGKPCPDYLPAHAHADLLSFELTVGGRPVIVDSGVYEYREGKWRTYFRSTAAHNTIGIDQHDQSEMWGSFRVGRRAAPLAVTWRTAGDAVAAAGEHDGYRRLPAAAIHRRSIAAVGRAWLILDRVTGRGLASATSYVHLHPDVRPRPSGDRTFALSDTGLTIEVMEGASLLWTRGHYSEQFGEMRENDVLCIQFAGSLPWRSGYVVSFGEPIDDVVARAKKQFGPEWSV